MTTTDDERVEAALWAAMELSFLVHTHAGREEITAFLDTADVPALLIALASMVDIESNLNDLLSWNQLSQAAREPVHERLHRAHRSVTALRAGGYPISEDLQDLEKHYQWLSGFTENLRRTG